MHKLRSIQVLRGVAACSVVVMHAYMDGRPIDGSVARLGAAGVDLFFVISGFIMATIPKDSNFLADRFWRIFPLWWIAVLPWLFIQPFSRPQLATSLTLWPVFDRFYAPALSVGWTLSFELLFYAAVALAARIGTRIPLALFGVALIGRYTTDSPFFDFVGNPIIFEFLFGVVVAQVPLDRRLGAPMIALAVILFAVSPLGIYKADTAVYSPQSFVRPLFWGFPAALLVYGCLCLEHRFKANAWALPVLLGDASYSIYLFHKGPTELLKLAWPLELGMGVGFGVLAWVVFERNIQRCKPWRRGPLHEFSVVGQPVGIEPVGPHP